MIGGVILAAGGSRRFGGPKQLAELDGRPLIEHALLAMAQAPGVGHAVVVLGAQAEQILAAVDLGPVTPVLCPDWQEGQAASLRAGVAALAEQAEAIVLTLGDQPLIGAEAIGRVLDARDGRAPAVRATYAHRPGHTVVVERALFADLLQLRGDLGARELLGKREVLHVSCDDLGRPDDVDTAEQLSALTHRRQTADGPRSADL